MDSTLATPATYILTVESIPSLQKYEYVGGLITLNMRPKEQVTVYSSSLLEMPFEYINSTVNFKEVVTDL